MDRLAALFEQQPLACGIWLAALLASTLFRPWQSLRAPAIQNPWLGAIVLVSALWSLRVLLPQAFALQLSAACLLVLMLGLVLSTAFYVSLYFSFVDCFMFGAPRDLLSKTS